MMRIKVYGLSPDDLADDFDGVMTDQGKQSGDQVTIWEGEVRTINNDVNNVTPVTKRRQITLRVP